MNEFKVYLFYGKAKTVTGTIAGKNIDLINSAGDRNINWIYDRPLILISWKFT